MLGKLVKNLLHPQKADIPAGELPMRENSVARPKPNEESAAAPLPPLPAGAFQEPAGPAANPYDARIIISFLIESRSDGLASGASTLADICRSEGYDYRLIDVRKQTWEAELTPLMTRADEICCVFSHMGMGGAWVSNMPEGLRPLWRQSGIPFISAFGDHPAYYWDRHIARGQGYSSIYVFQEHLDAALAWLHPQPLAAFLEPWPRDALEKQDLDFAAKRSGEIFFFKNGNDPQALLRFWATLPGPISAWLLELSHSLDMLKIGHGLKPLHEIVLGFLLDRRFYPGPAHWIQAFMVAQLDDYARRVKSTLMVDALLDLPVHVFGDNWGHVDFTGRRAVHHAGQSYFKTRELVNQALAVIDMSPNTESSPHERFMGAIGRHTLCLNNTQRYYLDNYPGAGQMLFDFDERSLQDRVSCVLGNPAGHVDYGVAVADHARKIHPPAKAVSSLIDFARMTRFVDARGPFAGQQEFVNWPIADQ